MNLNKVNSKHNNDANYNDSKSFGKMYKFEKQDFNEAVHGFIKFNPPTIAQKKKDAIPAEIFLEPLTNLKDFQHYNSVSEIQRRYKETIVRKSVSEADKHVKRRKIGTLDPIDDIKCPLPKLPDKLKEKQDLLVKPEIQDIEVVLARGHAKNHVTQATVVKPPHIYGKCYITDLIDKAMSYEGETNIPKIISILREQPEIKFLYLTHTLDKKCTNYHYYNLKVVSYHNVIKEDFYMVSLNGCTHIVAGDEIDHISLDRFEFEYEMYTKMKKIPTFNQFRIWKAFIRWRKVIKYTKFHQCSKFLLNHLFIINSSLRPALLNVREMCHRISDMGLCKVEKGRTYTLIDFMNAQIAQLNEVASKLTEFRELVREVIRSACRTSLLENGFFPDDYFIDGTDTPNYGEMEMYDIEELIDGCKLGGSKNKLKKIIYDINNPLTGRAVKQLNFTLKYVTNCRLKVERKRNGKLKGKGPPGTGSSYMMQSYDMDVYAEAPDKMTYTEQANKRNHCQRLTNFIRLADYLIVNTMHVLAVNSVYTLLNYISDQLKKTPTAEEIFNYKIIVGEVIRNEDYEDLSRPEEQVKVEPIKQSSIEDIKPPEEEKAVVIPPLFITEFVLSVQNLLFLPDRERFQEGITEVIKRFQNTVLSVQNLVPDTYFDSFTKPVINNKFEEKTCGEGPSMAAMFAEDAHLHNLINQTSDAIDAAFNACDKYASTFVELRQFYEKNESTDLDAIRTGKYDEIGVHKGEAKRKKLLDDVEFFREAFSRYHREIRMCKLISEQKPIGMILVDATKMKQLMLPSPQRCLDVINEMLPVIARKEVDALIKESQDAEYTLCNEPTNTVDYVNALNFLSEIQVRMEPLEREADVIKEMYDLIDAFKVPTPPEDFAVYQTLYPSIDRAKNAIDKALADRDGNIDKFCASLDKDIAELRREIKDIRQAINNPLILDVKANKHEVKEELEKLKNTMNELQTRAFTYKSYQKNFKDMTLKITGSSLEVEQARMEDLEEVAAELKLKQILWDSLDEWDSRYNEWLREEFMKLNPEDLGTQTAKYVKIVAQLEKGLPPNQVVPVLKDKVEQMREKMSVITNLLNPCLQERHWQQIEDIINYKFSESEEKLTLGKLIELNVFDYKEELEEISGQASSEASLEALLKKVEEAWQITEYVVLPHKDSKDVFILGGTDEIQQLWDDSNINVATIASSRHVGPIKPRVDEWVKNLDLFGKTIEEWLNCQRNWLYLESIFSAPDIQRQLPSEAKSFMSVDKSYKEIMRKVQKVPLAMRATTTPGLLDTFKNNNQLLDQIQKCLEAYLESKRVIFPRFYFLSNDELLEILAQTRNPLAVQPHLRKCFDAISKLDFAIAETPKVESSDGMPQTPQPQEVKYTNDILAMISPEGEKVSLGKGLKARGNVEEWLGKVEEAMFLNLRKLLRQSITEFDTLEREEWLKAHANQIVLTVEQMMWCREITAILEDVVEERLQGMIDFEVKCFQDLNKLAGLVRGVLPKLFRATLCALITVNVHARDMVTEMVKEKVSDINCFEWQKQLRYYWDSTLDNCVVRMSNSLYTYGYEYLGCSPRLVITPLTDRCYLCLMGALQLDLGGAPAGPAGTGKTETTKDLAKSLAKQCVVFNCSDGLDYKMMGRFFSGLAQSGAWCCFDEFNRIDIEVLSVIAQQLITIRNAKAAKISRFMFEGREIKLVMTCAAFITMNPGYAGRTELPDNLKALFRPIAMMVPDYRLIAEVILYSEGFESSKTLAQKMTQMYKLCSEQLSQQDHYDFGMRALKSVLVMAGQLKRENPDKPEDVVLIRALRDSNLPKFLKQDAELFRAILQDLFPGVELPEHDYGRFKLEIEYVIENSGLQINPSQVLKVIQFYETLAVRHGVMLVGPTGGGKTTVYNVLAKVLGNLNAAGLAEERPDYQPVKMYILNPKSITMGELYGEVNKLTLEWHDGLMPYIVRITCVDTSQDHQWVICDGPVDALWIENMNTVLDDNKMLCLANSERIKLTPYVHMLFEVQDLSVASPATVSRCGMVYVDPEELGWMPFVKTWLNSMTGKLKIEVIDYLYGMFEKYIDDGLKFAQTKCIQTMAQVSIAKIQTMCRLLESLLVGPGAPNLNVDAQKLNPTIAIAFVFCYLWGIGGNLHESNWDSFDNFVRNKFEDNGDCRMPSQGDLWSSYADLHSRKMDLWEKIVPVFKFNKEVPFFEMIVPTVDTIRFGYLLEKLLHVKQSVLFTGATGVGKSVVARGTLNNISENAGYVPIFINFSAQTSSNRTQEMIENKLEKKRKAVLGAPTNKRVIIFIDDLNMPKLDTYGSQPPIELLRQYQDFGGFYDRDKLNWITIQDMTLSAACGPPGGGRNPVSARLLRHFAMFSIPAPSEISLRQIFTSILTGFFADFPQQVRGCTENIVLAAVEIYNRMYTDLLPTPAKSHYVFNLRDLSKCIQGILQCDPSCVRDKSGVFKLFCHEAQRVFHDRLINHEDKMFFHQIVAEMASKYFGENIEPESFIKLPIIFGDFMKPGLEKHERLYEPLTDFAKVKNILHSYLDDFNMASSKEMKLVFFMDAIDHIARIARMIRQDRGNALLVGVGGTGKQSLTRLAAFMNGYNCFQIELCRGYDYNMFHTDLKKIYEWTGINNQHTVFLFTDTQIVVEEFLEDINNILNSGEVPSLFEPDEYERMIIGCRAAAKEAGVSEGNRDGIFEFCINRVRNNLHIVLCMSPVGSSFRSRCRMFPSLVNCCTIDWFTAWPEEALLNVAKSSFEHVDIGEDELKVKLALMCTEIHTSVAKESERFYAELKRHYYTTPTSYLELITLYLSMLTEKKKQLVTRRDRVKNGLTKILETNELIATMEVELVALRPQLEQKQKDTEALMQKLGTDQEQADIVRDKVKEDEAVAKVKAKETQAIADDAQRDLDEAMPALENAIKALDALDKNDIAEIRVFTNPPQMVQTVMESVCLLLGQKTDWASAKSVLGDPYFLKKLADYPKDNIPEALLKKLKRYIDDPNFTAENVEKVSKACRSLVLWVRAMDIYSKTVKTVEPKKKRLEIANKELDEVMGKLRQKQAELLAVENKIAELQKIYDNSVTEKKALEHNLALTSARLKRAGKLTTALADEKERWTESVSKFNEELGNVVGDVFMGAACVAYYGAFTSSYRHELLSGWIGRCRELEIPVSEHITLMGVLGDAFELRQWNSEGLPRDQVSTENAILVTRGRRWPLMIDPQEQANRWIRNKETVNQLKIIKLSEGNFLRTLENCIRLGMPALLEDIGETLDPALEPILLKQTFVKAGRTLIHLGDSDIEYSKDFKLYITTKLSNPHYMPEICIKVTIINFTVTPQGLEDQLLGEVTRLERPELEEQRNNLIIRINNDKNQLQITENRILKLLFESEGNILDHEDLINTLNESKVTSAETTKRIAEAELTEQKITVARSKYIPVAGRGSVMYFVVANMAEIDPMYQFSLKYFKTLFNNTIENSQKSQDLEERIKILLAETTIATYNNVARGLFEKDKLVFSFMLCIQIMRQNGLISDMEWEFFLRGIGGIEKKRPEKPHDPWISLNVWNNVVDVSDIIPVFSNLINDITQMHIEVTIGELTISVNQEQNDSYRPLPPVPSEEAIQKSRLDSEFAKSLSGHYDLRLTSFQKLILVKTFCEEKIVLCITEFVKLNLGTRFVEPPPTDLPLLFQDMSKVSPLVFVLSTGSDPMNQFQRFAKEKNYMERVQAISLGQGQGPVAEKMMDAAAKIGDWVFLQNCHLAASWMVRLEEIVKKRSENPYEVHENFRLFLSSMPAKTFPISVLQNSVKVTNEPPKGLRANIKRAFNEMSPQFFETHVLGLVWRKLIFGICFFHSIILDRKKFGPLGWNIRYEFSDSDRECAILNLGMFCADGVIQWDALTYITAEITYGGRVTDFWDQRCLRNILTTFFHPKTIVEDYKYSQSGIYYPPEFETINEYKDFVDSLPLLEEPEIFGMHENANLSFQIQETQKLINTILDVQPRIAAGGTGRTTDDIVYELADQILEKLIDKINPEEAKPDLFHPDEKGRLNSLTTVLMQEVDRFNKLLSVIKNSLVQLKKAIKGFVVMSEELESVYTAFTNNQVPNLWSNVAYPSLKPLSTWVKDLAMRCSSTYFWMVQGAPKSFWLPGFFFPQGFLTGTLQNYARKYDYPIDHLSFEFIVYKDYRNQEEVLKQMKELKFGEVIEADKHLSSPPDGVLVHGLYMDGMRWDDENGQIITSIRGEMLGVLPIMHMMPKMDYEPESTKYISPLYKTEERAGVLSTTGMSTNFVVAVPLPTDQESNFWINMGAALICENSKAL